MGDYSYLDNANPAYIEALYEQYKTDPQSIDKYWRKFFDGYEFSSNGSSQADPVSNKEIAVFKLINAFRSRGHLIAKTNPVRERRSHKADLELDYFGLSEKDLNQEFEASKNAKIGKATLSVLLEHLKKTYCGSLGVEFMYSRNEQLRQWLYESMESIANKPNFSVEEKKHIAKKINEAVMFEEFLHTKYVGKKRFSLEGVESLIPALDAAIEESADLGAKEFILGMAHRGRLNVLVNIFGKKVEEVFAEFEGTQRPAEMKGDGDVKYHLGRSSDIITKNGHKVHLALAANPSHLEAVNPVVQGMVYAKQNMIYEGDDSKVIPIMIHGDSAIAGQGVNYELSNISKVNGYEVGGTVHIVINNQLGFTTTYKEARTSMYCTDLAKVTESPVFHVNADDPEAVVYAVKKAIRIRMQFNIDVYVDILGYRRYGHNEGDEPRFTQPYLYTLIDKHPSVKKIFFDKLLQEKIISKEEITKLETELKAYYQEKLEMVKEKQKPLSIDLLQGKWLGLRQSNDDDFDSSVETGVSKKSLDKIAKKLVENPTEIHAIKKTDRLLSGRNQNYFEKNQVDWGLAELLAYGSLLLEKKNVRLSGQDCKRGTFSHRHAVLKDSETEDDYVPINNIEKGQGVFEVLNSTLSEYCILGFEFGVSMTMPNALTIWEAQFGDFVNGAQIMIDQFITSSESKWSRLSGLTMLLPHGYEGQGPEHSSARPERFLQQCAENNMYVVNATTPANLFHLLRRQVHNKFRIPLVVFSPKSLLRHPKVVSSVKDLEKGSFQEIIDDTYVKKEKVRRVVLCTGKMYYDLAEEQENGKHTDVAIVRIEQMYPLPKKQLAKLKTKYKSAKEWLWAQEEPENMGAWTHMLRHLREFNLSVIARKESASPATANEKEHGVTQNRLVTQAFKK